MKLVSNSFSHLNTVSYGLGGVRQALATPVEVGGADAVTLLGEWTGARPRATS